MAAINGVRSPSRMRTATASALRGSPGRVVCADSRAQPRASPQRLQSNKSQTQQQPQHPSLAQRSQRLQPLSMQAIAQPSHAAETADTVPPPALPQREALLCQRFKAHTSALTTALVLTDSGDQQQIITASLDKTVALWSVQGSELPGPNDGPRVCLGGLDSGLRVSMRGAPIFSLALDNETVGSGRKQVFVGTAAKEILAWEPPQPEPIPNVSLDGHTGWVRALATHGHWLFSCSCNTLRQWDMSRAVPRLVNEVKSFTGDILAACTGNNHIFTASANGAIRSWAIGKAGELTPAFSNEHAHIDRITGIAWHAGFLYTASADGSLRMWDASLEQVTCVKAAHDGGKLNCLTVGPDNLIYTGGDDKLIRRWRAGVSAAGLLAEAAPPLFCHNASVRVLAAGPKHTIVSGDSRGDVAVWRI